MPEVIIENRRTGESYAIQSSDFRRGKHYRNPKSGEMETYADAGFRIVSLGDGSEYTGPLNDAPADRAQGEHAP